MGGVSNAVEPSSTLGSLGPSIAMTLKHVEYAMDSIPNEHRQVGGLQLEKSSNIDRERVLMDK